MKDRIITMTMEERSGGIERAAPASSSASSTTGSLLPTVRNDFPLDASYPLQRAGKRSFDVAFLVAPDEKLARRQYEKLRLVSTDRLTGNPPTVDRLSDETANYPQQRQQQRPRSDRSPENLTVKHFDALKRRNPPISTDNSLSPPYLSPRTLTPTLPGLSPDPESGRYANQRPVGKTPSPTLFPQHPNQPSRVNLGTNLPESVETSNIMGNKVFDGISCPTRRSETRSAFTKVCLSGNPRNGNFDEGQTSPRSSISPDRASYQSSVSPPAVGSIPITTGYKYANFPTVKMGYPFLVNTDGHQSGLLETLKVPALNQISKPMSPVKMAGFRPEHPSVYPNISYNPITVFPPMAEALTRPRFLTTAASVGLLPPSFALALPAQNVCAKCNLSFRMTSDLVYHMRSHHKNENAGEAARRRREEKLRCPVCDESFRERHHLTRHMTAHQDKESDAIVDQVDNKRRTASVHGK